MTGLRVAIGAVAVVLAFGGYRKLTDGRAREAALDEPTLGPTELGTPLGSTATFVQFSSKVCAPCVATGRLLSGLTAQRDDVNHVEIDGEERLDLVREFGINRTPTVFLLDPDGAIRYRFVGPSRKAEFVDALAELQAA